MGRFGQGDHCEIEVEREFLWLYVEDWNDEAGLVFGGLDSEPVDNANLHLGEDLAGAYERVLGPGGTASSRQGPTWNGCSHRSQMQLFFAKSPVWTPEEMEPRARLELATCRLRIGCSTN